MELWNGSAFDKSEHRGCLLSPRILAARSKIRLDVTLTDEMVEKVVNISDELNRFFQLNKVAFNESREDGSETFQDT